MSADDPKDEPLPTAVKDEKNDKKGGCCGGCCSAKEGNEEHHEKNPILDGGLQQSRGWCGCWSDPLFTLVFFGFVIAMFYVYGKAMADGNYKRIVYGTDWAGNACGDSKYGTDNKKHQYWANPLYYKQLGSQCLETCPGTSTVPNTTQMSKAVPVGESTNVTKNVQSCANCKIYCSCNTVLTVGRREAGVSNSLNDTNTVSWLGKECQKTMGTNNKDSKAVARGPDNGHAVTYVVFDTSKSLGASGLDYTGSMLSETSVEKSLYYYLPGAWQAGYASNMQAATSLASGGALPEAKMYIPNCNFGYTTTQLLNRCVPKIDSKTYENVFCPRPDKDSPSACPGSSYFTEYFDGASEYGQRVFSDLWTCWYVFLVAWVIATVFGLMFMFFMKSCGKCFVWLVILTAIATSVLLFIACATFAVHLQNQMDIEPQLATYETDKRNMYISWAFASIFGALSFVLFCAAVCLCSAINQAADLLSLASEAMVDFWYLIFYPPGQILGIGFLAVMWTMGALQLASSGAQETELMYGTSQYKYTDDQKYMAIFWLFGGFWFAEFIMACGFMIVSFAFAIWFFSPEVDTNDDGEKDRRVTPSWVLVKSMKLTYCHHIGTLAFGSLLLAIVDVIRVIVEYIDKKEKEYLEDPPCLWKFIFCCLRCCLCCLDKCLRFFNKHAYIQTVINGKDLCTGACRALKIMLGQIDLFAALVGVQGAVFWFGRLAISIGTAAVCGLWISRLDVSSITLPTLVCLFIGYIISNTVMCVYELGIDTMVMCWCEVKTNDQEPGVVPPDCIPKKLTGELEAAGVRRDTQADDLKKRQQDRRDTKAAKLRESADRAQAGPSQGESSKTTV